MAYITGRDIREGHRIKTWFMPNGTVVLCCEPYCGPLQHLWPEGARIITFAATTKSGQLAMTVGNDEREELA